jgi:cell division protein FtsA
LGEIIEPRVQEIFELVQHELVQAGYDGLIASGVVLTGGAVIMDGVPELAEQVFNLPVRRGTPRGIGGLVDVVNSPMYATGVGLVLYGSRQQGTEGRFRVGEKNLFAKVVKVFKRWVEEFF